MNAWEFTLPIYTEGKPGYQPLPFHTSFRKAVEIARAQGNRLRMVPDLIPRGFAPAAECWPPPIIMLSLERIRTGPDTCTWGFTPLSAADAALLAQHWRDFA